jgi:hypothetical protein
MYQWGIAAIVVALSLSLSGCGTPPISKNLRVELRLTIGGHATAWSTVQSLSITRLGGDGTGVFQKYKIRVNGGALIVQPAADLPALVVLMGGEKGYEYSLLACMNSGQGDDFMRVLGEFSGTCRIPDDYLPTVLAMTDLKDPFAVQAFHLTKLTEWFGIPVEFAGVTLTATAEPVDRRILKILPWTQSGQRPTRGITAQYADGTPGSIELEYSDFVREIDR